MPVLELLLRLTVSAALLAAGLSKESSRATVIVPEATPAVIVCAAVVKAKWLAAAGLTVSCCVAERLPAATVSVGVPAAVSEYSKLTVAAPAGIVTGDAGINVPVEEVVLSATVKGLAASTRLPRESSRATEIVPEATPAVSVCGAVVNTSWLAAAESTVSCCVAEVRLPLAAVSTGVPADVSLYWKLALLLPAGIVSGDAGANEPVRELLLRLTVTAVPEVTGLPNESSRATVIVPDVMPAVSVCGGVVKASWLAAAGSTVSCCVAEGRAPAVAVSVGVPAELSV